jgi:NADH-quinone oxidoreductase subunit N
MAQIALPGIEFMVILQILIIFVSATALLLIDLFIPASQKRITAMLALAATVAALIAGPFSQSGTTMANAVAFGPSTLIVNSIILFATAISILFASDAMQKQGIERGETYVLMLLATGGMLLLAQGASLVTLFMGLELLSIALYVLTAIAYPRIASEEAGLKYLIIGAFGAGFLVFGIAFTFGATGSLVLSEIAARIPSSGIERGLFFSGIGLMLVGFGYKVSLVPFHMWTPDVYQGAPTPITAFMSVGSKVAGFIAIIALMGLAVLTMLGGSIVAINQTSLKRMLAYSSISHAGFVLLGVIGSTEASGLRAPIFYLAAYTLTNLAAFGVIMSLEGSDERDLTIADLRGLWSRNPWLTGIMSLALLSLAGVPPTVGFLGKFLVLSAVWQAGYGWLALVAALASAFAAFFYLRTLLSMFSGTTDVPRAITSTRSTVALLIVAVGIVAVGLMPWSISAIALAGS